MKNVIVIVAMVLVSITAWAQPKGSKDGKNFSTEERMNDRLEYMTIVLDLNESQVQKIKTLQKGNSETLKGIKAKYQPTMDKMKAEMKELKGNEDSDPKATKEKMKAIKDKYKTELEPMKDEMKAAKEKFDADFKSVLNADQKAKYDKLQALKDAKKEQHQKEGFQKGDMNRGDFKGKAPHQKRQIEEKPAGIE